MSVASLNDWIMTIISISIYFYDYFNVERWQILREIHIFPKKGLRNKLPRARFSCAAYFNILYFSSDWIEPLNM